MAALRLRIRGRVQGVGYRLAFFEQARALELRGWVRNYSDGSVEAGVAGPDAVLAEICAWANRGPATARVDAVDILPCADDSAPGFRIAETD